MKNKLTKEEELFQQKLNEVSFEYDAASWTELNNSMTQKSFFSSYSSFIKAIAGLSVFLGAVFIMNTVYNNEEQPSKAVEQAGVSETDEKVDDASLQEKEVTVQKENNSRIKDDNGKPSSEKTSTTFTNKKEETKETMDESPEKEVPLTFDEQKEESNHPESVPNFTFNKLRAIGKTCLNEPIRFSVDHYGTLSDNLNIQWFIDGKRIKGKGTNNSYNFDVAGQHEILVKAFNGSKIVSTATTTIELMSEPDLTFSVEDSKDVYSDLNARFSILYPVTGNYTWFVDSDAKAKYGKEIQYAFDKEGKHEVTVKHEAANGCKSSYTKTVDIQNDFKEIFPDAFTPNGDGNNDVFELEVFRLRNDKYELKIFDFNGKQVFHSTRPEEGWNGRLNNTGQLLPAQTYAWIVEIENENGQKRIFKNKVKLLVSNN